MLSDYWLEDRSDKCITADRWTTTVSAGSDSLSLVHQTDKFSCLVSSYHHNKNNMKPFNSSQEPQNNLYDKNQLQPLSLGPHYCWVTTKVFRSIHKHRTGALCNSASRHQTSKRHERGNHTRHRKLCSYKSMRPSDTQPPWLTWEVVTTLMVKISAWCLHVKLTLTLWSADTLWINISLCASCQSCGRTPPPPPSTPPLPCPPSSVRHWQSHARSVHLNNTLGDIRHNLTTAEKQWQVFDHLNSVRFMSESKWCLLFLRKKASVNISVGFCKSRLICLI